MYNKLTDNIYWGDWKSLYELKNVVKAVVCVANNKEMIEGGYSPLVLPQGVPYFCLAQRDGAFPSDDYFKMLCQVFIDLKDRTPILVHCCKGIHRSPIIAIMAVLATEKRSFKFDSKEIASLYGERDYGILMKFVSIAIPDFERTRNYNYSTAAQKWIEKYLL